jgi:hypothetical protein
VILSKVCKDGVKSRTCARLAEGPQRTIRRTPAFTVGYPSIRVVFACSAALLAATAGDAALEGISNAGILWHGHYTDRSSLNLLPAFLVAALAIVTTLCLLVRRQAREAGASMRSLLLSSSRSLAKQDVVRLLPAIFLLQMLVLFSIETTEQFAVYGRCFGGTLWMGAPVVASLFGHALFTALSALTLSNWLHATTEVLVRIVTCMLMLLAALTDARPMRRLHSERICVVQLLASAVAGERGPPLFIAL